ncbi:malate synthase [Jiangella anatolica]|uniref:malate synthase n=1 Tax=Jiangella anatolica TaxID=2670374 RepID=UPI001F1CA8F3|nr:hypothetical protein [Jiangella anatolica]
MTTTIQTRPPLPAPPSAPATSPVRVTGPAVPGADEILTPAALRFLADLHRRFAGRRAELLAARQERRQRIADGENPDFLPETKAIRDDPEWRVPPLPAGLLDPGADVGRADFEDTATPHLVNVVTGQLDLRATHRPAIVRPRGWHLTEKHLRVDDQPMAAALVDAGLYVFHHAGAGPWFRLPKLESHQEARLWHDVFAHAEDVLGLERGTIRATVIVETITAAFEAEEILYELGEHAAGLEADESDYLFSIVKTFRSRGRRFVLPDRSAVTADVPFLRAYTELLAYTERRRVDGDGAGRRPVTAADLLDVAATPGMVTEDGLRGSVAVAIGYLEAWLGGRGTVTAGGLVADTAAAELARSQIWQWIETETPLDDGRLITPRLVRYLVEEEVERLLAEAGEDAERGGRVETARRLFEEAALEPAYPTFLTIAAYARHV